MSSPAPLPIMAALPELIATVCKNKRAVVVAAAGAGKTTLFPEALARRLREPSTAPKGRVVVTQPKRLSARAAAHRTASLRKERCGRSIGYQVRFDDCTSEETEVIFVTEGLFLRQLLGNPDANGIACVILDEFHGRTRELDLILGIVLAAHRRQAAPFFLVVMSATLDADRLGHHLDAPIIKITGRPFAVDIEHLARAEDCALEKQVARALTKVFDPGRDDGGDILIFLPGQKEIERTHLATTALLERHGVQGVRLYGSMSPKEQDAVLSVAAHRRCIFATNIAETSVTLPKVTVVIDSGLVRMLFCDPATGVAGLRIAAADQAALVQRAGRAGRVAPGRCLRLLTRLDEARRPQFVAPEILRLDLTEPTLQLAAASLPSLRELPLLDAPEQSSCSRAELELVTLGAFEKLSQGVLTPVGEALASLPLHPRIARLALSLSGQGHLNFAARAAALLSESAHKADDAVNAHHALYDSDLEYQLTHARSSGENAQLVVAQITQRLRAIGHAIRASPRPRPRAEALSVACLDAFGDRVAKRLPPLGPRAGVLPLQMARGGSAQLSERSGVRETDFLLPLRARSLGPKRPLQVEWAHGLTADELLMYGGDRIEERHEVTYDTRQEKVIATTSIVYDDLILNESIGSFVPQASIAEVLIEAMQKLVATHGFGALLDETRLRILRGRVEAVARGGGLEAAQTEALGDEKIWHAIKDAARSSRSRLELQKADLVSKLEASLGTDVAHRLRTYAPTHLNVGKKQTSLPIVYATGEMPMIRARLQVFLGMKQTPTIGPRRLPIVLHLLGPNMRVLQVTQDLSGFWTRHYPKLRPALMRRYPRHAWPEDPFSG